ncbi:MAG: 2-hydroxyacyl-CoA dehydratase [Syntrophaceae bacterium]|nr:2-hydroxyacyl-CoA dehydratase [Syntrophaceae bacterium]
MSKAFNYTRGILDTLFKPGAEFLKSQGGDKILLGEIIEMLAAPYDDLLHAWDKGDRPVVLFENGLVPQLFYAFDCAHLCLEVQPLIFSQSKTEVLHNFLALAEEAGLPSDICSTDRFFVGAALSGEYPANANYVTTTMPCDGTRTAYPILEKIFKKKMCYIESTNAYGDEAAKWFGKQIKSTLIPYLEEITGKRFDIDRFREVVEESNKAYELMLDIYDAYTMVPSPHRAALRQVPHVGYMTQAGSPRLTEFFKKMNADIKRIIDGNIKPKYEEKHRVLWAHVPPAYDLGLFGWMEKTFGATVAAITIMNPAITPIDTTNVDTMLEGYARQGLDLTMALLRISAEDMLNYMVDIYYRFKCDCIIMTQHVGCNNICGKVGVARYLCKKYDAPLLTIEMDYNDNRVTPSESLREQIEEFFTAVMK